MKKHSFLLSLIALHGLFLIMALTWGGYQIPDSYDYQYQSENLVNHGSFYAWNWGETIKEDYYSKRTPGYAVLITILGNQSFLILLIQNLLSILLFYVLYRWLNGQGLKEGRTAIFLVAVLVLQNNQLIYANSIISEIPFQFAVLFGVLYFWKAHQKGHVSGFYLSGLCFALALLIKPVLLFFWIPFTALIIYEFFRIKNWKLLPVLALLPLTIFCWSAYNARVTGHYHYTSISAVNLRDYNTRLLIESEYGVDSADALIKDIKRESARRKFYGERLDYTKERCIGIIKEHPVAYAKIHLKGMLAMLLDPGRYDWVSFLDIKDASPSGMMYYLAHGEYRKMWKVVRGQSPAVSFFFFLNLFGSSALLIGSFFGVLRWKKDGFLLFLLLGIIFYFWVLTGPVGTARYKSAILPFLVVLASHGFLSRVSDSKE